MRWRGGEQCQARLADFTSQTSAVNRLLCNLNLSHCRLTRILLLDFLAYYINFGHDVSPSTITAPDDTTRDINQRAYRRVCVAGLELYVAAVLIEGYRNSPHGENIVLCGVSGFRVNHEAASGVFTSIGNCFNDSRCTQPFCHR